MAAETALIFGFETSSNLLLSYNPTQQQSRRQQSQASYASNKKASWTDEEPWNWFGQNVTQQLLAPLNLVDGLHFAYQAFSAGRTMAVIISARAR